MKIQNFVVNHKSRPVKSNPALITRPKKGNGIVILDKTFCEKKILKIISDD